MNTNLGSPPYNPITIEVLYEQLEDEESPVSEYIRSCTLNFILKELEIPERQTFLHLLAGDGDPDPAFAYAEGKIQDFDTRLQLHINDAMVKLLETH
jgi:hypothetical protein